jgi:transcriptional regulator with XRE-family HTH domain
LKKQVEIEKETGILQSHISKYLNGVMIPTYPNAKLIANSLDMSVESFYEMIYKRRMARNK